MSPQEKGAAKRLLAKVQDYHNTFSSPHGKRVLYDMMVAHFVINPLPHDPNERDRAEGERNVVLRIFSKLKLDPSKVEKLIKESDDYASRQNTIE